MTAVLPSGLKGSGKGETVKLVNMFWAKFKESMEELEKEGFGHFLSMKKSLMS